MSDADDVTTYAAVWAARVESHPNSRFLVFEAPDGSVAQWSYGEFDFEVARVASLLVTSNVGPGSAVHLALTNCPTFVAVWMATVRLGAWIVPSDPMSRTPELADHIARTSPVVGFCSCERSETYRQACSDAMTIVEIDEADASFRPFTAMGFEASDDFEWPTPAPMDRAAVAFTSGTTGRPKGVEISQANYAFAGRTMAEAADITAADRQLVVLPLFHVNAQYYSFASAIWAGASVALMHTFSASGFLGQVARHQATCASLFAAPIRMILARGEAVDGANLRHCWFAQNLADDQYDTFARWIGCQPRQLYGMTETIPAVLTDHGEAPRADSMGFVTDGCQVQVHDAAGVPTPDGEVGEIVVGGVPGLTLFTSYLDDPDTTDASYRGSWFRTGDRALRDSDGRFFFDGRRSDVLKVGGENVSTVEVEAVLTSHPLVLEASVVGAPDSIRDEVPVAFVVAADPSNSPTVEALRQWCQQHLAKVKQPRDYTILEELPRTSVGKIRKFILKKEVDAR